jgi:uncharacterized protein (DUF2267 family)
MSVPAEYSRATDHFIQFLVDLRDSSGLVSTHQAYTMVQRVLQTFRQGLDIKDAILFAGILPVGLRALFVSDWDTDEPKRPFEDRAIMTKDVQMLRVEHNFAPDTAIRDVARALRRHVDEAALSRVLSKLPVGAKEYWEP